MTVSCFEKIILKLCQQYHSFGLDTTAQKELVKKNLIVIASSVKSGYDKIQII
ncbi:hypothetical protein NEIPOLOT_01188 [Neisseria polysaccharea ATCC 43768]|nr:hypothetical protein NEIPOLOT_01188 [Neisseria polysaccharea ATCC 43768]